MHRMYLCCNVWKQTSHLPSFSVVGFYQRVVHTVWFPWRYIYHRQLAAWDLVSLLQSHHVNTYIDSLQSPVVAINKISVAIELCEQTAFYDRYAKHTERLRLHQLLASCCYNVAITIKFSATYLVYCYLQCCSYKLPIWNTLIYRAISVIISISRSRSHVVWATFDLTDSKCQCFYRTVNHPM